MTRKPTSYFWFMSIQASNQGGVFLGSYQGTRTVKSGQNRLDLFNSIRAELAELDPRSADGAVIAFDLQPNEL
jgi:hypothetical protein